VKVYQLAADVQFTLGPADSSSLVCDLDKMFFYKVGCFPSVDVSFFISIALSTSYLNTADGPISNRQTNPSVGRCVTRVCPGTSVLSTFIGGLIKRMFLLIVPSLLFC